MLLIITAVGYALLSRIGRSSPLRLLHGRYVLGWVIVGWVVGSFIGLYLLDNIQFRRGEADGAFASTGLLAGLVTGSIHGAIAVWRKYRRTS